MDSQYKDETATAEDALKTILDPEDDAAYVKWGGDWRMPTNDEFKELLDNCYWKWVTSYNNKSVNGYIVYKLKDEKDVGHFGDSQYNPAGNYSISDPHIFLPAAGAYDENGYNEKEQTGTAFGGYWSSSLYLDLPPAAFNLQFNPYYASQSNTFRSSGYPVRPVCK